MPIPAIRLINANDAPLRHSGRYVLYWMVAQRRLRYNFALQHAVDEAKRLHKPLLIFEPLRLGYRWASERLHRFVIQGMQQQARYLLPDHAVGYYPYVEPKSAAESDLLPTLARDAALVVSDEHPGFFLPALARSVASRLAVRLQLVDGATVMPLRFADRTFTVAHSYRRWMQKRIFEVLDDPPKANPLAYVRLPKFPGLDRKLLHRWPAADLDALLAPGGLARLSIDHGVAAVEDSPGGEPEARRRLRRFLDQSLDHYGDDRNHPDRQATSGLSPYLHFGHISPHEILDAVLQQQAWTPAQLGQPNGKNHSFWNIGQAAEGFLDQLLTWRELGFNMAHRHPHQHDRYESLPDWARRTLDRHRRDRRPVVYTLQQFEQAETQDEIWNAAQRQLVRSGTMHNYLRMLWGKLILHWTASPEEALAVMIQLNNKYALDGRDPNSYSGIFWTLGRYDRPWGPTRPVFGNVRYMTSGSTRKKLRLEAYLRRYAPGSSGV